MLSESQRLLALEGARASVLLRDAAALEKLLRTARRRIAEGKPVDRVLGKAESLAGKSQKEVARLAQAVPSIVYPDLPVSQRREEILDTIDKNQVVVLCGDTGSGKTTQLPKMALALGRGVRGRIGCTQPRRIAATSVARRVAEELKTRVGGPVGYQVRFDDRTGRDTMIKFMTDGILLAETRVDRSLWQYDTLIVDEAHERSLNIDFLLGYLKELLPSRPDLKVIISSATLDADSFSEFFGNCPVVNVEGRTFPVEDEWFPAMNDDEPISKHVARAAEWITKKDKEGDILVFLPGEREIRNAADKIRGYKWPKTEVLPLFARLDLSQQQKVFTVGGRRRIVLATNVAETSLTIPGIRYVIDSGVARITRFNARTQVQSLQVRPVSQASVRQRRGRCGRMANGVCVHLYTEEDYEKRIPFTPPEIRRSSLAGVILRMKSLGLPEITEFPFVDPPQKALVREGMRTLFEIGALDEEGELTNLGRDLARFPVDPRLARMIVAGQERGVLAEVMIIAAGLSVQDPRDRPHEKAAEADQAHKRWQQAGSDFIGLLRLWNDLQKLSGRKALRTFCRNNFVNMRRVMEWQNILRELGELGREFGWERKRSKGKVQADAIHKALLAGLPSHIGWREEGVAFRGAYERKFHLFPGSVLHGSPPEWVMAFSLVETTRLYARQAAVLEPGWLEEVAPHLCKASYHDPKWNEKRGRVEATERISACGLGIMDGRQVAYGPINPVKARKVFLREAVASGRWRGKPRGRNRGKPPEWLVHHRSVLREVALMEQKLRRPHGLLDVDAIVAWFEERIPQEICDAASFDRWRAEHGDEADEALKISVAEACYEQQHGFAVFGAGAFPDELHGCRLRYVCAPEEVYDGVTMEVGLGHLGALPKWAGEWLVPGMLPEKVMLLLRALPKSVRHGLNPLSRVVSGFSEVKPEGAIVPALCSFLRKEFEVSVSPGDFGEVVYPPFLEMNFAVKDGRKTVAAGRELAKLKAAMAVEVKERFQEETAEQFGATGQVNWTFGELPEVVLVGADMVGYPALVDEGRTVGLTAFPAKADARLQHRLGLARLFQLEAPEVVAYLGKRIPMEWSVVAELMTMGADQKQNREDLVRRFILNVLGDPRNAEDWNIQQLKTRGYLYSEAEKFGKVLTAVIEGYRSVSARLEGMRNSVAYLEGVADVDGQIHGLFFPRYLVLAENVEEYPRYLKALDLRLERMERKPDKDAVKLAQVEPFKARASATEGERFAALVEEFRIAVFAPEVGTKEKITAKRLEREWTRLIGGEVEDEPEEVKDGTEGTDADSGEPAPDTVQENHATGVAAKEAPDAASLAEELSKAWGVG